MLEANIKTSGGGVVKARFTEVADGDFSIATGTPPEVLEARRRGVSPRRWVWTRLEHGTRVYEVGDPAEITGRPGDALVTRRDDIALAVHVADCSPVLLVKDSGAFGVVHAGWRGLLAGVVRAAADALGELDDGPILAAWTGPIVSTAHYEFGREDLQRFVVRYGPGAAGETSWGAPALDLRHCLRHDLEALGVEHIDISEACTAEDSRFYSYRARGERERNALVAWYERA